MQISNVKSLLLMRAQVPELEAQVEIEQLHVLRDDIGCRLLGMWFGLCYLVWYNLPRVLPFI